MSPSEPSPVTGLPVPDRRSTANAQEAAAYIRRLIFEGHLLGNQHVPQDDIAAALGISRVPIREALVSLQREGWVTIERNRGAFVAPLSAWSVRDHFEVLGVVYATAVRLAVERGDGTLALRLKEIAAGFADLDDADRVADTAVAFHAAVVDASRSTRIRAVLRSIRAFVPGNLYEQIPAAAPFEKDSTAVVCRAVERGDGEAAAAEYERMLQHIGDLVVQLLVARGVLADR